ncbi:MAG: hypothetical protein J6M44_17400 [Butyrivibrio sp.]|uniref:hypothetical protein n=1 Tax=Butyrivibrio sp. TaxID=28121 RepID=UPI001B7B638E|nr:hypothetical protein [Butyrivibrio sp.]MBP3280725.1 hypothetical protein [Butyrivibrio sp.]MBP3782106.1 hypothetical protein [Butyrivibrio sp.]
MYNEHKNNSGAVIALSFSLLFISFACFFSVVMIGKAIGPEQMNQAGSLFSFMFVEMADLMKKLTILGTACFVGGLGIYGFSLYKVHKDLTSWE